MTTTERPAPALTQCPSWCELPTGHAWESDGDGRGLSRTHAHNLDPDPVDGEPDPQHNGNWRICMYEHVDADGTVTYNWRMPGDVMKVYFEQDLQCQQSIDTMAVLALSLPAGVALAVADPSCTEDTHAIRRVLAERAVLDAVRAWVDEAASTGTVEDAYVRLAAVLAEEVEQ